MGIIRLANVSDALQLTILNDVFNGVGSNTTEEIENTIKSNNQEVVLVAIDSNNLIGFCCGNVFTSICYPYRYAEITELYVREEYRNQGIAKNLLIHMEEELKNRGVKHFHILTGNDNHVAQHLYLSLGYSKTTEILLEKNTSDII